MEHPSTGKDGSLNRFSYVFNEKRNEKENIKNDERREEEAL